jgi:hypothetical protein
MVDSLHILTAIALAEVKIAAVMIPRQYTTKCLTLKRMKTRTSWKPTTSWCPALQMFQPLLLHQYLNITTDLDLGCKAQGQGLVITVPF